MPTDDDVRERFPRKVNGAAPASRSGIVTQADTLMGKEFEAIRWVVPGVVPEGLSLLAGKPKSGKSYMLLGWAIAVGLGGYTMGQQVTEGDALYLALEDNERRLQSRLRQALGDVMPRRLELSTEWARLDQGGIEQIDAWIKTADNPRLVGVDVLAKVRPMRRKDEGLYEADYRALSDLKQLADHHRIGISVVHHVSKRTEVEDPFDAVSGTTGITGVPDTVLVLRKTGEGTILHGRGRDMPEIEQAVRFDERTGMWTMLGNAADVTRSDERKRILDVLEHALSPPTPTEIASMVGMKVNNVHQLLHKMLRHGEVDQAEGRRGRYTLPAARPTSTAGQWVQD